jgi:hypothetical protein
LFNQKLTHVYSFNKTAFWCSTLMIVSSL